MQPDDGSVKLVGRWHEERGRCLLAAGDTARALESFERAVSINAALSSSWSALEQLHRANGDAHKAAVAAQHLATLQRLPAALVRAGSLFSDGELDCARRVLLEFLQVQGKHAEALRLLGRIALARHQLDEAANLFEQVLSTAPDYRAARADLARALIEQQHYSAAQQHLSRLLEAEPENADSLFLWANIQAGLGQHERAIVTYQQVLARTRAWPELYLLLGNSLKAVGRRQEAIDSYRAAAASRPSLGDAYWSLANLKTYRFCERELAQMRSLAAAASTQEVDRYHLCFALGKALEDLGRYEESWGFYQRGNTLKAACTPYDSLGIESEVERLMAAEWRADAAPAPPGPTPIFIVGMPRSGSTLVEQILASHPLVEGTQELPILDRVDSGEQYLEEARKYAAGGKPYFIDKMPNNFRHIGRIHRMLPTAKIIDVRRDPMACCFSNLKQLYARGQDFSYSIDAVARYYKSYVRLMEHWDAMLPGRVLQVAYEDLVEDLATQVARLLRFCELEPQAACLRFYATHRSVSTASSEQVRQPIFRTGLTQWRHYEPWLGELKKALAC